MSPQTGNTEFYRIAAQEAAETLRCDVQRGLTTEEAHERLKQYGLNKLLERAATPAWRRFLAQLQNALVVLLIIAAVIALLVWYVERDPWLPYDAIVILSIVILNAVLGFVQEERAEKAVAA